MKILAILDYYSKHGLYESKHEYLEKLNHLTYFASLEKITIENIHAYCDYRRLSNVKNATINRELTIIRSAINFYNKHTQSNIPNLFNGFKLFEEDFIPTYLNLDECKRLIAAAQRLSNRYACAYICLLLYTGCRAGELMYLTWDNVFLDDAYIVIRNSLSKNKKTVYKPLNEQALLLLIELRKANPSNWVFYNESTRKGYRSFRKHWVNVLEMSGLSLRMHDLRHTFASLLIQQGVPIYHVSQLLGHSDTRITQRYAHLSPNNLQDVVNLLKF